MQTPSSSHPADEPAKSANPNDPSDYNPFDEVEFLPGLGVAVLWVVLAYVFVNLLLLPVHAV
jgi:hypothetical protein